MAWRVREADESEWQLLSTLRLRALAEDPRSSGSSYDHEAPFDAARWREFLAPFHWYVAETAAEAVGLVAVRLDHDDPGGAEVISMWVEAAHRGNGSARALLDAVISWARARGAPTVTLWVTQTNERARHFYERRGFVATGRAEPLRSDPRFDTLEYSMPL